jgi:hypothetical protein
MNNYEIIILSLFIYHSLIWILSIFLCFFSFKISKIILVFILPIIYLFQSLPFHKILLLELLFIRKYKQYLNKIPKSERINKYYNKRTRSDFKYYSRILNIELKELLELFDYYYYYINKISIIKYFYKIKNYFDNTSFVNPLSPQGLIILCYIMNITYLWYNNIIKL